MNNRVVASDCCVNAHIIACESISSELMNEGLGNLDLEIFIPLALYIRAPVALRFNTV